MPETLGVVVLVVAVVLVLFLLGCFRIAKEYERAVIFRWGRYERVAGPGLYVVLPILWRVERKLLVRTVNSPLNAEETMTADTVPVTVQAVIFWRVADPKLAVLAVEDFKDSVQQAASAALRETIGATTLTRILSDRHHIDDQLAQAIASRVQPWGILVERVDILDIAIPPAMVDVMSRHAQAVQESLARVTLAESEVAVAEATIRAAALYDRSPTAFRLRQMDLTYQIGQNSKNTTIFMPTELSASMVGPALAQAAR